MTHRTAMKALAAAAAAATVLTLAPAAHAERVTRDDGADATGSTTDIREVRVKHGNRWVRTEINFPNLRKKGNASLTIFFDTDKGSKGPEYGVGLPLFSGADYMLAETNGWKPTDEFVNCRYTAKFDWAGDKVVFRARRGCFDRPAELRVGMKMVDRAGGDVVRDWLNGRRGATRWLASGAA